MQDFARRLVLCLILVVMVASRPAFAENWALLIGVDQYDNGGLEPLRGTGNDVIALQKALVGSSACKADHIVILALKANRRPDSQTILYEIDSLVSRVQKGDTVLVYFGGHGFQSGNNRFLLPSDVRWQSVSRAEKTALDISTFEGSLSRLTEARVLLIYDVRRLLPPRDNGDTSQRPATAEFQGSGTEVPGMVPDVAVNPSGGSFLARWWSCSPGNLIYEQPRPDANSQWRGYFSAALERGLNGEAVTGGRVSLPGLISYVSESLRRDVMQDQQSSQIPRLLIERGNVADLRPVVLCENSATTGPMAYLRIKSNVSDTVATINGEAIREHEKGWLLTDAETKPISVTLSAAGYQSETREVTLARGTVQEVVLDLKRLGSATPVKPAILALTVIPPTAAVTVNGKAVKSGKVSVPLSRQTENVSVQATASGYGTQTQSVTLTQGKTTTLNISLKAGTTPPPPPVPVSAPRTLAEYRAQMVKIPAGKFDMGSNAGDPDQRPVHRVTLSAFKMGRTPVTVAMWREYCNAAKINMPDKPQWGWIDDHPIVNISYLDAKAYCEWAGLRLPTEAQWEYAARAGKDVRYPWGNVPKDYLWVHGQNSRAQTAPVVREKYTFKNPFGLTDMLGNVMQWCADFYEPYSAAPVANPIASAGGAFPVARGASWETSLVIRTTSRSRFPVSYSAPTIGFRAVALE